MQQDKFYLHQSYEQVNFYKNRIFITLVGPSDSGKTYLIHEWLIVGKFQPKFEKIYFFYQQAQSLYDAMQKEIDNLEFVQGVHSLSLKKTVTSICSVLMTHVQKFATLRSLWTLPPLADIADLVLYTMNTTYSTQVN